MTKVDLHMKVIPLWLSIKCPKESNKQYINVIQNAMTNKKHSNTKINIKFVRIIIDCLQFYCDNMITLHLMKQLQQNWIQSVSSFNTSKSMKCMWKDKDMKTNVMNIFSTLNWKNIMKNMLVHKWRNLYIVMLVYDISYRSPIYIYI